MLDPYRDINQDFLVPVLILAVVAMLIQQTMATVAKTIWRSISRTYTSGKLIPVKIFSNNK